MPNTHKKAKRVLIIAFYFPPTLTGGVFRPLKFTKYLDNFAWQPIVLTAKHLSFLYHDPELLNEISDVVRVSCAPFLSPTILARRIKKVCRACFGLRSLKSRRTTRMNINTPPIHQTNNSDTTPVLARLINSILIPEAQVLWLPFALIRALYLIRRYSISVILTTSPPNSSHLLGPILKKISQVKWIADFRDPWFGNSLEQFRSMFLPNQRLKVEKFLLKTTLSSADAIVNIGYGESNDLQRCFPDVNKNKFHVIHNGYDPEDFPQKTFNQSRNSTLTLCHLGYLYKGSADEFFNTITDLLTEEYEMRNHLKIQFIGQIDQTYESLIYRSDFRTTFKLYGQLPHSEALKVLLECDVLLVFLCGFGKSEIPGKIFEYLATKKPVLALAPKTGDTAQILLESGLGIIVEPGQSEQLKHVLRDLYNRKLTNGITIHVNEDFLAKFDRKHLTKQLADIMGKITETK